MNHELHDETDDIGQQGDSDSAPKRDSAISSETGTEDSLITSADNKNNNKSSNKSSSGNIGNAAKHHNSVLGGGYPSDISKKYVIMDGILGEGSFGTVRKCRLLGSNHVCALKTIDKSKLPDATQLRREVDILLNVDHPHIIKLYDVYEDETTIYLVSELCSGGELYDRVVEKTKSKEGHFSEYTAARIIRNILSAISYCHDVKKIVHRDLKPENFLLTDKTDNAQVKVIDFGLSRYSADRMKSQVGTIYYVAPEVLFGEYTDKADIWSIGVVAYVLLCGFPPFNAGSEGLTYNVVKEGNVKFPSPAWDKISPGAIHFIKRLLDKDPDSRPSAAEALKDPWVTHEYVINNPFKKIWHGTFLSKSYNNETSDNEDTEIDHADQERQTAFEKLLLSSKKKKNRAHQQHQHQRHPSNGSSNNTITESIRSYLRGEFHSEKNKALTGSTTTLSNADSSSLTGSANTSITESLRSYLRGTGV